jgi:hypothetical protein
MGGDLSALEAFGKSLQFDGAQPLRITRSSDQETAVARPEPEGRRLLVTLGDAQVSAVLLEGISPFATDALARRLPLVGTATNTVSSGPLTRFWDPVGGPEGETPLELDGDEPDGRLAPSDDAHQQILYPGFMYYLPSRPWRGIRTAFRDATVMKGALSSESPSLVPLAQFIGDWSPAREAAERLRFVGSTPMRIELA